MTIISLDTLLSQVPDPKELSEPCNSQPQVSWSAGGGGGFSICHQSAACFTTDLVLELFFLFCSLILVLPAL